MLPELGLFCTILAFSLALLQIFIYNSKISVLQIMRPVAIGQTFFITLSFVCLAICFINNDFSVGFVAQNSNSSLPIYYKIPAIWGAHEGSLLLWIFIVSFWALLLAVNSKQWSKNFSNAVFLIFALVNAGLLGILLFKSNPFARIFDNIPIDGNDLNPLLQDIGMILHPPILYLGYVGSTIGFAFACAALVTGKLDQAWAAALRPWALVTWMFLTIGIALGSWWAYYELGWGGWWFWDPVENASFMPWLTSTALLHCLIVGQRYGRLLWLAVSLAITTFMLSLFGTFLVRSGSIVSVHAFASDPQRGYLFMALIVTLCSFIAWLLFTRLRKIQVTPIVSASSQRITLFLFANSILLLIATATVLLGTTFPLLAGIFGGDAITVGAPYFNMVFIPIMLILLVLMLQFLTRSKVIWFVLIAALGAASFLFVNFHNVKLGAWLAVTVAIAMVLSSYKRGSLSMQLAHIGLAIMLLGIAITPAYEIEKDLRLVVGDSVAIANFNVLFDQITAIEGANYVGFKAAFKIAKHKSDLSTIYPEKRTYLFPQMSMSETAILPAIQQDIYIALGQKLDRHAWAVRIYYKPYIRCIWLGAIVMAIGALIGIFRINSLFKHDH